MTYLYFYGIDVSKDWIDVARHGSTAVERYANDIGGFARLADAEGARLREGFLVLEATGGYEDALTAFLIGAGVTVHRADPLRAKRFVQSLRLRGKTDRLDALALARYAADRHACLRRSKPCDPAQAECAALIARRGDLVSMRAAEQARRKHPRYRQMRDSLDAVIRSLSAEIAWLEERLDACIEATAELAARHAVMVTVKGVGKHTANTLIAAMPELGTLTRRQAASLAGLAPHPRDSGQKNPYRPIDGGRTNVRNALYMAALSARRTNPTLKAFYEKLIQNGKKPLVALTALMRKLITVLNAKIRDNLVSHHGR